MARNRDLITNPHTMLRIVCPAELVLASNWTLNFKD
jgi:hypothetical protein